MGKISKKIPFLIAIILFLISISLLLFPTVNNAVYQAYNKSSIKEYSNNVSSLSKAEKEKYLDDAKTYNEALTETVTDAFIENSYEHIKPDYETVLNFNDGQICSVEIPKINVNLPVYHGTSEDVLTKGAAHSANTSFPIGGNNTHTVISAHTAYPGKVFFDDLTELVKGDTIIINILDEKLAYKVCDISIVEPEDTSKLQIIYDKDLVTLVTCYPYAVNSHRLYVTGERTSDTATADEASYSENNKTANINLYIIVPISILILIVCIVCITKKICVPPRDS